MRNVYNILVGNPDGTGQCQGFWCRWKDNVIYLNGNVVWIGFIRLMIWSGDTFLLKMIDYKSSDSTNARNFFLLTEVLKNGFAVWSGWLVVGCFCDELTKSDHKVFFCLISKCSLSESKMKTIYEFFFHIMEGCDSNS